MIVTLPELFQHLMYCALIVVGFYRAFSPDNIFYFIRKDLFDDRVKTLSEVKEYGRISELRKFYKPLFLCPACMSSVYGTIYSFCFALIGILKSEEQVIITLYDLFGSTLLVAVFFIVPLTGLLHIIQNMTERNG